MNGPAIQSGTGILSVRDLSICVDDLAGSVPVVQELALTLRQGETFALVGESGCGKSLTALALLRLLPEAVRLASGQVLLEGDDLLRLPEARMRALRGGRIGMVFQEPSTSLNPVLSVGQQLLETILVHTPLRGAQARRHAEAWLERVGIAQAAQRFHDYPFQFSGGQKQRILIAIALAGEPAVLVADEPTTALDVTVQAQVLALLEDIQQEMGLALLLITHDLAVVRQVADRVALMRHGRIVELQPARQFFSAPTHPYARELLAAIPSFEKRGQRLSPASTGATPEQADGRRFDTSAMTTASHDGQSRPAALTVQALSVAYRGRSRLWRQAPAHEVVQSVSFTLQQGESLALLGESGCGKTTVAKALLGLLDHQARVGGQAWLGETELPLGAGGGRRPLTQRRAMQIVFQDPYASLDPRMPVGDILDEGLAALRPDLARGERRKQVGVLLDRVGLPAGTVDRYPHEFSGGQRQRIAIARALAVQPQVLICDEPTSALDVSVQAQILELLQALQRETGLAYLFITHNFGVVEYLADRVAIMDQGRIVESGDTAQVLRHPASEQAQRLLQAVPRL